MSWCFEQASRLDGLEAQHDHTSSSFGSSMHGLRQSNAKHQQEYDDLEAFNDNNSNQDDDNSECDRVGLMAD
jgi:hypothetical protein